MIRKTIRSSLLLISSMTGIAVLYTGPGDESSCDVIQGGLGLENGVSRQGVEQELPEKPWMLRFGEDLTPDKIMFQSELYPDDPGMGRTPGEVHVLSNIHLWAESNGAARVQDPRNAWSLEIPVRLFNGSFPNGQTNEISPRIPVRDCTRVWDAPDDKDTLTPQ